MEGRSKYTVPQFDVEAPDWLVPNVQRVAMLIEQSQFQELNISSK